jgi:glycosyltransferase involved in cell wall biosynthesis
VVGVKPHTILHTIDSSGPGGAETVVLNLASHLDPQQFRSLAVVSKGSWVSQELAQRGVPIFTLPERSYRLPGGLAKLIRQEKVAIVHSHLPDMNFYGSLASKLAGCKAIVTYHGPVELAEANRWRNALKLWMVAKAATSIVVVCDYVSRMLVQAGFPASKITRIYNGVNLNLPQRNGRKTLRQELGLTDDNKLVGMIANVRQSKGYEFFIRAAKQVAGSDSKVRFVAVGDIDSALATPLYRILDELSLRNRFQFVGFRTDVPEILSELDVFVLSSTAEGFPLVTLEAMAAGKPVVVTRCGGPQEVVDDGQTGFLVPNRDSEALAGRISEILAAPHRAAEMGSAARCKVMREFSIAKMIANYEALYRNLLRSE